ncbi:MAG: AAA family ATPase [Gemmatimonadales bacterium]
MKNDPRGSLWRKWDLHVHSPASFHWNGPRLTGNEDEDDVLLAAMVDAIRTADAAAFCIMDYWHFDGWFALRDYLTRTGQSLPKAVFPGIELRLEAPTDFRLNTHFLFDDTLSKQQLQDFHSQLNIGVVNRSPSREAFIQLAKEYDSGKLASHGYSLADRTDDAKMAKLGERTARITRDSWRKAQKVLAGRILLIQPYDTNDGLEDLDWKRHPYDDAELMRAADFFETRNLRHVKLFLGVPHPQKPQLLEDFRTTLGGRWKPVLSGSDAHRFSDYASFPDGKSGWIKSDTTFAGLKQCTVDPIGRVFIGTEPPKLRHVLEHSTKYIARIRVRKVPGGTFPEKWFDCDLAVNPGMVAVIGNRGGGKSALADALAIAGNSHCASYEFLNTRRFRKPSDNKAQHFEATIWWENGDDVTVSLAADPLLDQPERVRYLPQQYLEQLCSDVGTEGRTIFEDELRKVIFSHVPMAKRLGLPTLSEVVSYRTEQADEHAAGLRYKLSVINADIHSVEGMLVPEFSAALVAQIQLKETELAAHDDRRPLEVEATVERGQGGDAQVVQLIDALRSEAQAKGERVDLLKAEQVRLEAAAAAASRLVQRLRNIESEIRRVIDDASDDGRVAGIDVTSLITFRVNVSVAAERLAALRAETEGVAQALSVAEAELVAAGETLALEQEKASEPEQRYQAYLEAIQDWQKQRDQIVGGGDLPGTLDYLRTKLREVQQSAPGRLALLSEERNALVKQLYDVIADQLEIYRDLYGPIELAASGHEFITSQLGLGFNVVVEGSGFAERLLLLLNQGRKGSFYGHDEGEALARRLVQSADFSNWDGTKAFIDETLSALRYDQRDGRGSAVALASQLRDGFTVPQLYDLLFGLTYLRPRLTLQLAGKEVGELSPGERGILLLVFYLLLDQEEIPLIIDQPEHNLDNASVFRLLEPCIRRAKNRRQIILVTHNPNVAIVCDAEQVIVAEIDKLDGYRVTYTSGAIENPTLNLHAVDVLEGTWPAFETRDSAYQRPTPT